MTLRPESTDRADKRPDAGFALLSALAIIAVIATVTLIFVSVIQIRTKVTANAVQSAKLQLIADGLARQAAFQLMLRIHSGSLTQKSQHDGYRCQPQEGIEAVVVLRDQSGLVDLNAASPDTLRLLFDNKRGNTDAIIAAIQDFRDEDSHKLAGGAEAEEYKLARKSYAPKNAAFNATGELDQVLGMTAELRVDIEPYVTVFNFQDGFDPTVAPKLLADRAKRNAAFRTTQSPKQFFAIDVIASGSNGGRFHRHAIAAMTNEPQRLFQFVEWSRGDGRPPPAEDLPRSDSCWLPTDVS